MDMTQTQNNKVQIIVENVTRTINYWGEIVTKNYGKKVHVITDEFETYVHFSDDGIIESLISENELLDLGLSHSQLFQYAK
jgi:NADH/NAD ratio-sensing transcriptional regulator Rex